MAKVLAISSQTAFGPVGNSAAVPALQRLGHDVLQLPTILLSFHPGHGRPAGQRTPAPLMAEMLGKLESLGALEDCAAVMTGYFADAEQVQVAADVIARLRRSNTALTILVDPVMGDDGTLYVPETVARAIRSLLLPLATIATPNAFELSWLTETEVHDSASARRAAAVLGTPQVLVTSVPGDNDAIVTLLCHDGTCHSHASARRKAVPHGTGDHLAGLYLAHRLMAEPATAFRQAMADLEAAIALSAGQRALSITA